MKRLLSIILLSILFAPTIFKLGVEVYYLLNKDYIAANLCINKDRPITMCYGRCYVDTKFQMIDQTPVQSSSLSQITFDLSDFLVSDFVFKKQASTCSSFFSQPNDPSLIDGYLLSVFRPPLA